MHIQKIIAQIVKEHKLPLTFFTESGKVSRSDAFRIIWYDSVPNEPLLITFLEELGMTRYDLIVLLSGSPVKISAAKKRIDKRIVKLKKEFDERKKQRIKDKAREEREKLNALRERYRQNKLNNSISTI